MPASKGLPDAKARGRLWPYRKGAASGGLLLGLGLQAAGVQLAFLGRGPLAWSGAQSGESVFALNCESLNIEELVLP